MHDATAARDSEVRYPSLDGLAKPKKAISNPSGPRKCLLLRRWHIGESERGAFTKRMHAAFSAARMAPMHPLIL